MRYHKPAQVRIFSLGKKWAMTLPNLPKDQWKNIMFVLQHKYGCTYKPASKSYVFASGEPDEIADFLRKQLPNARVYVDRDNQRERFDKTSFASPTVREPDPMLDFRELTGVSPASLDEAKRAFRTAAIRLHPDRGGDPDLMARLNIAWSKLQGRFAS